MHFEGEYRDLGPVPIDALRTQVEAIDEADWIADTGRQEAFRAHRKTQTIPLVYDADMRHAAQTVLPAYERFRAAVEPIADVVRSCYPAVEAEGYFVRIILVRLGAGESIGTHRDHGESLSKAHRVHVPVLTNERAEFGIAGQVRHLPAGEAFEINNRKPHAVRNMGDAARIHLILDYVVPGETVNDPDAGLLRA